MCTYSQLKKKLYVTPQGVNGAPFVPKLYASSRIDISKCIEGGSMKFTTLVDYIYIYVCAVTNAFPCNECKIRGGGGGFKTPPPIFCPHAFNLGATLLCVGDISQKIV